MALHSLEKMLGKKGYVKLADGVYLYGEITETGTSGLSGYYAVLEGLSNGRQIKAAIWGYAGLIQKRPVGRIIGGLRRYACESCSLVKDDVVWREETEQYECEECWEYWRRENGL